MQEYYSLIVFISYWAFDLVRIFRKDVNLKLESKIIIIQVLHLMPLVLFKFMWAFYIDTHGIKKSFATLSITETKIDLIPQILHAAELQILGRPYILFAIFLICEFTFFETFKLAKIKIPVIYISICISNCCGMILFHLLSYLLTFVPYEATCIIQLIYCASLINAGTSLIIYFIKSDLTSNSNTIIASGSLFSLIFFSGVVLNSEKFNTADNVNPNLKYVAEKIIDKYPKGKPLLIVDLGTNGIDATIIRFYTNSYMPIGYVNSISLDGPLSEDIFKEWTKDYEYIYIHSGSDQQISLIKKYITLSGKNCTIKMKKETKKIAVLLPCFNEQKTIHEVVCAFRLALPEATIYVCNNN